MPEGQNLPCNLEAERAILGACLISDQAVDQAIDLLAPSDFFRDAHRLLWKTIQGLAEQADSQIDLVTIKNALSGDELERVGGPAYIAGLVDGIPRSTNIKDYARIVKQRAGQRTAIFTLDALRGELFKANDWQSDGTKAGDLAGRLTEAIDELDAGADPSSVAPFIALADAETGDMEPPVVLPWLAWKGAISVIGGPPKAGKSTLIGNAVAAACRGQLFLGRDAGELGKVGLVTEEAIRTSASRLVTGYGVDASNGVFLAGTGSRGILAAVRRLSPDLLVIDSLTAFAVAGGVETMNDPAEIRRVMNKLRAIAESGTAVLIVHHGRKSDGKLADSRDIEAAVDIVIRFDPVQSDLDETWRTCDPEDSSNRRLTYRGRWPVDSILLHYSGGQCGEYSRLTAVADPTAKEHDDGTRASTLV